MKRMSFNSNGKIESIDGRLIDFSGNNEADMEERTNLKKSEDMSFLKDESISVDKFSDTLYWSLYNQKNFLPPMKFSNGKTQEDVVAETIEHIKNGKKIVLIHGACGTGKSAIALNIARVLGKAAIVVPVKGLQRQYEEDYTRDKYLLKNDGKKMKIAVITGRDNHDSIFNPGVPCSDPNLPDTIKIAEKNYQKLREYYLLNPYVKNKTLPDIKKLKRIAIAPANPYWSPILPEEYDIQAFKDARKIKYLGLQGRNFIFYHRKPGCSYFDQYLSYTEADVIIFNSAKYKIECALDRKPQTAVDIIDEADEFLDNFVSQENLNLTRLASSLGSLNTDIPSAVESINYLMELIHLEGKNKDALGININKIFNIKDTKIYSILHTLLKNHELQAEIELNDESYANAGLEVAYQFADFLDETYVMFRRDEKDLHASLVTTNVSKKFNELVEKNQALVLMSGTLHSEAVLKHVFGLNNFARVDAETAFAGIVEVHCTGNEFDCKHENFTKEIYTRREYLKSLNSCLEKAKKPALIHVNAFSDLPTQSEIRDYGFFSLMSSEVLREQQFRDKTGKAISDFKQKKISSLFTTKCSRGVDFPGDICNSVIFTKYPNPNSTDIFWTLLKKTHPSYYWEFYNDKAHREFLQRIYRAVRSMNDHVYILSPDIRVINAVQNEQRKTPITHSSI